MTEIIILFITSVICIIGLAEIIHEVKLYIYAPQKRGITYKVIYLDKDLAEQQLSYAVAEYIWQGKRHIDNIIAVNTFLSGEVLENCRRIAEKNNIYYCSGEELEKAIRIFENRA